MTSEMRGWHQHFVQPFFQTNQMGSWRSRKNTKPHSHFQWFARLWDVGHGVCVCITLSSLRSMPSQWVDRNSFLTMRLIIYIINEMCVVPVFSHWFSGFRLHTWLRGRPIRSLIDMMILLKRKVRRGLGFCALGFMISTKLPGEIIGTFIMRLIRLKKRQKHCC